MMSKEEIRILKRMNRFGLWGAKHIRLNNLIRTGFPAHERGKIKKLIKGLIRKGFIVYYSKSKEAVQLNFRYYKEIQKVIENGNNKH